MAPLRSYFAKWRRFLLRSGTGDEGGDRDPTEAATPKKSRPPRHRRFLKMAVLGVLALFLTLFVLLGLAALAISLIPDARILAQVSTMFHEKTGGTLLVKDGRVQLFYGIELNDVRVYVDGDTTQTPLLQADKLRLQYNLPALLLGRLTVSDAHVYAPRAHLVQKDGVWNFAKLIPPSSQPPAPPPTPAEDHRPLAEKLPMSPAALLAPLKIALHHIGVTDLSATVVMEGAAAGQTPAVKAQHSLEGLDLRVDVDWFLKNSQLALAVRGHRDGTLRLRSQSTAPIPRVIDATIAVDQSLVFKNLADLNFDLAVEAKTLTADKLHLTHLPLTVSLKAHVPPSLTSLRIDHLGVRALDMAQYDLQGNVLMPQGTFDTFLLDLNQKIAVDLDAANRFASLAKLPVQTAGFLRINDFKVEGPLHLPALGPQMNFSQLPSVALGLELDHIHAASAEWGFKLVNLTGKTTLMTRVSPASPNLQAEVDSQIAFDQVSVKKAIKGRQHQARVENFSNRLALRAQYPSLDVPFFRLKTAAKSVQADRGGGERINLPFKLDAQGSVGSALSDVDATLRANLGEILQFAFEASCEKRCTAFTFRQDARVASLAKVYALAKPFAAAVLPPEKVPETLRGRILMSAEGEGSTKNPMEKDPAKLLRQTHLRFGVHAKVEDLSVKVPFMGVDLDRMNVRLAMDGDEKNQKVELTHNFASLKASVPFAGNTVPLQIAQYNFSTLVYNTLARLDDPKQIPKQTETRVDTKLFIGRTSAPGLLPTDLNGVAFAIAAEQQRMERIDLASLTFNVPDLGTDLSVTGSVTLKPDFKPAGFSTKVAFGVKNLDNLNLPAALKVKGQMGVDVEASSSDMNLFALKGKTSFDHFNVLVPNSAADAPPLLDLADMDGEIPFEQNIDVKAYMDVLAKLKKSTTAAPEATPKTDALTEYLARNAKQEDINSALPRLDYGNTRDFFPDRRPLSIRRVTAANLTLRDMVFDMEIKKDRFAINNFLINALDGKVQGSVFLAMSPMPQSVNVAVHMTKLNTEKMLENFPRLRDKTGTLLGTDPILEGAVHLDYDIAQNDMGGGIEITKIGKDQLKMILYYLDPEEKDATLGNIRKALYVGNVTKVSVPIKNGYIGLDVGVSVLAVPIPLPKLSRFPIAQLVNNIRASQNQAAPPVAAEEERTPHEGTH